MTTTKRSGAGGGAADSPPGCGFLPGLPLQPSWIEEHPAFLSAGADGRYLIGSLRLLLASWRGHPAGSIPASPAFIASCSGLPLDEVRSNFEMLTHGFEQRADGRLHHVGLSALVISMMSLHAKEIQAIQLSMAMTMQDPDQFSLIAPEAAAGRKPRGKTALPKLFGFEAHPNLREWLANEVSYPHPADQDWFMTAFKDFSSARDDRHKDWPSAFRNWVRNSISYKKVPPSRAVEVAGAGRSPFSTLVSRTASRGEQVAERNQALFSSMESRLRNASGERPAPPASAYQAG